MAAQTSHDVIVIGGGPAGAATATLVARQGHRVLLLERERFPRFHIGESLMPATYWSLRRLGVLDAMRRAPFPRKQSVQFFLGSGKATAPFHFPEADPHESSVTWQVDRGEFDRMLLEHAQREGVEVRQEVLVREVLFEGTRATGVRAEGAGRTPATWHARVIVDASGQSALLSRRLGIRRMNPRLRNASVFTRYRGALLDTGVDAGATLILHTANRDSWFWFIPLPENLVSVGVVGPLDYLITGRVADPQRVFDEEMAICPALRARLERATQVGAVRVLRDFSYTSARSAGDGWILVGDAFGFLDPIYSSGVFLALKSAELAADAIQEAFKADDFSAARLGSFEPGYLAGVEALRRLVYAFYSREFSFAKFLARNPDCRNQLIHLLMGNVYREPVDGLVRALDRELGTAPQGQPPPAGTRR